MPKKNGYVLYAEAMKPSLLAAGHTLSGGLKDLVDLCSEGWQKLSQEEKQRYTDEAKAFNVHHQSKSSKPVNGAPIPKNYLEHRPEDDPLILESLLCRNIICQYFQNPEWLSQPIVICSFTSYVEPNYEMLYLPAEVGLTAFSVKNGVMDNFARIIEPGPVKVGYGIEAIATVEKLGLPQLDTFPEFAEYKPLMMILGNFVEKYKFKGDENCYIFVFESDFIHVSRCFEWLFKKTGWRLPIKILSLNLWSYMASTFNNRIGSTSNAARPICKPGGNLAAQQGGSSFALVSSHRKVGETLIGSFVYSAAHPLVRYGYFVCEDDVEPVVKDVDNYKYFDELCCVYHLKNGEEIQNCALTMSNRYAFSILEVLTLSNDVPIIRGGHFPDVKNPSQEKARRYNMLRQWGITTMEEDMEHRKHELEPLVPTRHTYVPRGGHRGGFEERGSESRQARGNYGEGNGEHQERPWSRRTYTRKPEDRNRYFKESDEGQDGEPQDHSSTRLVLHGTEGANGENYGNQAAGEHYSGNGDSEQLPHDGRSRNRRTYTRKPGDRSRYFKESDKGQCEESEDFSSIRMALHETAQEYYVENDGNQAGAGVSYRGEKDGEGQQQERQRSRRTYTRKPGDRSRYFKESDEGEYEESVDHSSTRMVLHGNYGNQAGAGRVADAENRGTPFTEPVPSIFHGPQSSANARR